MSNETILLWTHVAAGFAALAVGPVVMRVRKRRGTHTRLGELYHWLVLCACGLAVAIVFGDYDRLWGFLPIAIGSYALALLGYVAAKVRWRDWMIWHVTGQCGSYIALVTAFFVANWPTIMHLTGLDWTGLAAHGRLGHTFDCRLSAHRLGQHSDRSKTREGKPFE